MSRYSGDSFRWRRGSGGRNNDAAGHSGHHWPPGGPGNQGYPNHKFSLLPDPYMSFEQQPTWTPNSLMPWLQQESWGWQQVPQATGFVPGGANFSKLPPKTHTEQQKQQQLNRQKQQKQSKSQKHNKQQQNLHHHHNQQQQQQQQQQKQQQQKQQQQKQQQKKQQQQELQQQQQQQQQQQKQQQQQTKANVEKKAGGNQLQKIESRQKPNPPPGSEEARRKALESTTDKLKRCLSSMGQERTEVCHPISVMFSSIS
ncbi:ras-interacting protein RIP3-like [Schistocerca cancellata]|uniref:ras-interacting protein RIP3-like n=1 Tax=Schistocerca cancellata TaxID=274614 RepID=UPI0021177ACE|nr:ras-interacting protein RIP3-like [Schistocerca cancellata]